MMRIVSNEMDNLKGSDIFNHLSPPYVYWRQMENGRVKRSIEVPWRTKKIRDIRVIYTP